jgi:hypothetical protein
MSTQMAGDWQKNEKEKDNGNRFFHAHKKGMSRKRH